MGPGVDIGGYAWSLADPFQTQEPSHLGVPAEAGLYLWLQREQPGPDGAATRRVLYAGKTSNLRTRLHGYSGTKYGREDPVLRALFDRVIAPGLADRDLRMVVEGRLAPGLTQMWVRDHVWFAWVVLPPDEVASAERLLIAECTPVFNPAGGGWTRYESTGHEMHDLTLPIVP